MDKKREGRKESRREGGREGGREGREGREGKTDAGEMRQQPGTKNRSKEKSGSCVSRNVLPYSCTAKR